MAKRTKAQQQKRQEAIEEIRRLFSPDDDRDRRTVYTTLNRVSKSGMSRAISFHIVRDGAIQQINYLIHAICEYPWAKGADGLRVDGCGMDMGFAVVYNLSYAALGDYPDHRTQSQQANDSRSHGYFLNQRWL